MKTVWRANSLMSDAGDAPETQRRRQNTVLTATMPQHRDRKQEYEQRASSRFSIKSAKRIARFEMAQSPPP